MKERLFFLICFLCISFMLKAADKPVIKISTENVDLIYRVGNNGRLYQSYLGKKLNHATDIAHLPQGSEAYLTHGMEDYFEPAIHIVHNDGNPSTLGIKEQIDTITNSYNKWLYLFLNILFATCYHNNVYISFHFHMGMDHFFRVSYLLQRLLPLSYLVQNQLFE